MFIQITKPMDDICVMNRQENIRLLLLSLGIKPRAFCNFHTPRIERQQGYDRNPNRIMINDAIPIWCIHLDTIHDNNGVVYRVRGSRVEVIQMHTDCNQTDKAGIEYNAGDKNEPRLRGSEAPHFPYAFNVVIAPHHLTTSLRATVFGVLGMRMLGIFS